MSDRVSFAGTVTTEGRRLKGSVLLKDQRTPRNGELVAVDPAALIKADASKAFASMEHDDSRLLGFMGNQTLTINRTEEGFEWETADLPNTSYANDALELVRGGYVSGSSFEIDGLRSTFSTDPDGTRVRTYTGIKQLLSVSPVRDPAFPSIAAAFSKESDVTTEVETPEPPKAEPAKFTEPKPDSVETFARTLPLDQLANQLDAIMDASGGNLQGEMLSRYEAFAKVFTERQAQDAEARQKAENLKAFHNARLGRAPKAPSQSEAFASEDYAQAFNAYLRTGRPAGLESFAQSIAGSGAEGGYTVPDGFLAKITERLVAFGGIAGVADEIVTSTGESLRWPYNDDTANSAAIAAEGVAGAAGADVVFDSISLGAWSYDANGTGNAPLKVSLELIQDSAIDIADFVSKALATRIGRKQAADLANGVGTTEPFGLFSKTPDAMTATVVSLAAPEHIFQVNSAYRDNGNCRWVMSDTTLAKIWTAQSTTNQPLFIPGGSTIVGKPGGTLYGYPITLDAAAGNNVAFGDIKAGYIVRRVRSVQVLVDPYTAQGTRQIAYHAWARMDANIQDPYAYSVSTWASVTADT